MRGIVALALALALALCPLAAQGQVTAGEGAVTCQEAVVYARASQSQEQDRLEAGTAVEVMALRDQWAKIGYGDQQVGYVLKSVLEPDAQPQEEEASIPTLVGRYVYVTAQVKMESGDGSNLTTLYPGDQVQLLGVEADQAQVLLISRSGSVPQNVLALDQAGGYPLGQDGGQDNLDMETRLEELGYMDGVPDATFDIQGVEAVLRLRAQAGLSDQFEIDEEFLDLLQDGQAPLSPILSASLEQGDSGDLVRRLQSRLTAKGYLEDATLGNYDLYTAQAVSLYQQVEGMEETGRADSATLARLFSGEALPLPEDMDPVCAGGSSYLAGGPVVNIDWWTGGIQEIFPRGGVALITDIATGISWYEMRRGGSSHADVQPLTAQDTQAFKAAVGSWSWERRAIWVTIDGVRYAASMNCMPHGEGAIKENGFPGHHCIHFLNSRTHGGDNLDPDHQACVALAARTTTLPAAD